MELGEASERVNNLMRRQLAHVHHLEELAEAAGLSRNWEWEDGHAIGSLSFNDGEITISLPMTITVIEDPLNPFMFEVPDANVQAQFSAASEATAFGHRISRLIPRR